FLPARAGQIAATLRGGSEGPAAPVLLVGDVRLAGRLRVLLGKDWTVVQTDQLNPADANRYTRILISENDAGVPGLHGWKIQTAAFTPGVPPRAEWWPALTSRQVPEILARHGR